MADCCLASRCQDVDDVDVTSLVKVTVKKEGKRGAEGELPQESAGQGE